jgi:TonB family protein
MSLRSNSLFFMMSLLLHALLVLALVKYRGPALSAPPKVAILTVETVSGVTPKGEGAGASGEKREITNAPPNPQPVPGSFKLQPHELPKKPLQKQLSKKQPKVRQAPSLAQLAKDHALMPIGLNPRDARQGDELSEGGMGDGKAAGSAGGQPEISGPIGGRGYRAIDWGFPKQLPEETTLKLVIVVAPNGLVKNAKLLQSSGYAEIDQNAVTRAKSITFDSLPAGVEQVDTEGTLTFNFQFQR